MPSFNLSTAIHACTACQCKVQHNFQLKSCLRVSSERLASSRKVPISANTVSCCFVCSAPHLLSWLHWAARYNMHIVYTAVVLTTGVRTYAKPAGQDYRCSVSVCQVSDTLRYRNTSQVVANSAFPRFICSSRAELAWMRRSTVSCLITRTHKLH